MADLKWPVLPGVEMDDAAWRQFVETGSLRMMKRPDGVLVPADPILAAEYAKILTLELAEDMAVAHPNLADAYDKAAQGSDDGTLDGLGADAPRREAMTEYPNSAVAIGDDLLAQVRWEARRRSFIMSSYVLGLIDRLDFAETRLAIVEGRPEPDRRETPPPD